MTAASRTRTPGGHEVGDPYLLESLWCLICCERMRPARLPDGTRVYACDDRCPQRHIEAGPLESDLLLRASLRAMATLHPDVARVTCVAASLVELADWDATAHHEPDTEQVRQWQRVDPGDHRAMLRTAFTRVDVQPDGLVRPAWRHRTGRR